MIRANLRINKNGDGSASLRIQFYNLASGEYMTEKDLKKMYKRDSKITIERKSFESSIHFKPELRKRVLSQVRQFVDDPRAQVTFKKRK